MFCLIIDFNRYTEEDLLLIAEKKHVFTHFVQLDTINNSIDLLKKLLLKFGIQIVDDRIIDGTTLRLTPDGATLLYNNASYLIAMSLTDFSKINRGDFEDDINNE